MNWLAGALVLAAVLLGGLRVAAAGPEEAESLGRDLYVTGCSSCHGLDGRGVDDRGPSLEAAGPASTDFYLSTGRMPLASSEDWATRRSPVYDEEEIAALVAYVDTFADGVAIPSVDPDAGDLAAGNVLYSANCAACHNAAGSGGAVGPDVIAPDLFASTALQTAEAVRVGPGAMPRFSEGVLDQDDLNDLVRYVEHLEDPVDRGGAPLGRVGPVPEGLVAWIVGLGAMVAVAVWIGTRERA